MACHLPGRAPTQHLDHRHTAHAPVQIPVICSKKAKAGISLLSLFSWTFAESNPANGSAICQGVRQRSTYGHRHTAHAPVQIPVICSKKARQALACPRFFRGPFAEWNPANGLPFARACNAVPTATAPDSNSRFLRQKKRRVSRWLTLHFILYYSSSF
jgi:hypothetical protein